MAQGKRVGVRAKRRFRPALLLLALGVTGALVAWGYLVWAAIDFGTAARGGDGAAWWFLALAAAGAVVCLFLALVLLARIGRAVGLLSPTDTRAATVTTRSEATSSTDPRRGGGGSADPPGGRRAAR